MAKRTFFTEEQIKAVFSDNKYLKKAKSILQDPEKMESLGRTIDKKLAMIHSLEDFNLCIRM